MISLVHTPTPSLEESLSFYGALDFAVVSAANPTIVRDGDNFIEIAPDRFARPGVKLYRDGWASRIPSIAKITEVRENPKGEGWYLGDTTGTWIYLVEGSADFEAAGEAPKSKLGNYAGLSLEAVETRRALDIWQALGFEATSGSLDEGYVSLQSEDGFVVTVMKPSSCPHLFFNPSMTYFNGANNLRVIQSIREAGIPITEEITHFNDEGVVDNVIVRDPGGYGFFVFND